MSSAAPAPAHLHPLHVNPQTGEPFLRLPAPLEHLIITPPRASDADALVRIFGDPRVYKHLRSPPFPYLRSHAESWLPLVIGEAQASLRALKEAYDAQEACDAREGAAARLPYVDSCPVRYIREEAGDGSGADELVGEISVLRCPYPEVQDAAERSRLITANLQLRAGDPDIVWCIGDFVAGPHHGRGIMTAALWTIMHQWMVPRMGARQIRAEAFIGNIGSVRVFEKNGFVLEDTVQCEIVTNCGERKTGSYVLRWRYTEE